MFGKWNSEEPIARRAANSDFFLGPPTRWSSEVKSALVGRFFNFVPSPKDPKEPTVSCSLKSLC